MYSASINEKIGTIAEKDFVSLEEDTLIADAAKVMRDKGISSVFVIKSKQKQEKRQAEGVSENHPIGILTERDILYRVLAENKSPYKVTIGEIMSSDSCSR